MPAVKISYSSLNPGLFSAILQFISKTNIAVERKTAEKENVNENYTQGKVLSRDRCSRFGARVGRLRHDGPQDGKVCPSAAWIDVFLFS